MYHDPSWDSLVVSPAQQYERARAARQRLNRVQLPRPAPVVKAVEVVAPVEPPKVEDVPAECEEIDAVDVAPAWCPPPLDLLLALNGMQPPLVVNEKIIKRLVSDEFDVTIDELVGETQVRKVVSARHVAVYLLRTLSGWSHPRIGRAFGNRDPATARHGCWVIEQGILDGTDLGKAAVALRDQLLGDVPPVFSGAETPLTNRPDAARGTPAGPVATA